MTPIAIVREQLEENRAVVEWIFNPIPDGEELAWPAGETTPREIFEAKGLLTPCPNAPHSFRLLGFLGEWQLAADCWSSLSDHGVLTDHFLSLGRIRDVDGLTAYKLILWKLKIQIAKV